jgi:hypothetical protein
MGKIMVWLEKFTCPQGGEVEKKVEKTSLKLLKHGVTAALRVPCAFVLAVYVLVLMLFFGDPEEDP